MATNDTTEPMDVGDSAPPTATGNAPPPWAVLGVDASTPQAHVDAFLNRFRPSQWTRDHVAWISLLRNDQSVPQGDTHTMVREWQWLCRHEHVSATELDRLARGYNVLSGKWILFCATKDVDQVWQRIAMAVAAGQLGPRAKVSPCEPNGEHVICVYTPNYLDRDEVQRVRNALRGLGHHERLLFKPDVLTHCGIYKGNAWGIPTYIYAD